MSGFCIIPEGTGYYRFNRKDGSPGKYLFVRVKRKDGKYTYRAAHRLVWENKHGALPRELTIEHICGNTFCTNIDHLRPVPLRNKIVENTNTIASKNNAKTHCVHGHEFTPENTYHRSPSPSRRTGGRMCRECIRQTNEVQAKRKKEIRRYGTAKTPTRTDLSGRKINNIILFPMHGG